MAIVDGQLARWTLASLIKLHARILALSMVEVRVGYEVNESAGLVRTSNQQIMNKLPKDLKGPEIGSHGRTQKRLQTGRLRLCRPRCVDEDWLWERPSKTACYRRE